MRRPARTLAAALAAMPCLPALADGGAPVASVRAGDTTWTLLVSPASPCVGPVEFTLLGADQPAAVLRVWEADQGTVQELRLEARPGVIGRWVHAQLDNAGACRFELVLDGVASPLLSGTLPVGSPQPPWQARWPWLLAWVPVAAVLALRALAMRCRAVI